MDSDNQRLEMVGSLVCAQVSANAAPWDFCLQPHHRGWNRAWSEVRRKCNQSGMSWQCMESSAAGHHFRQRACAENDGKNIWYTVAPQADDFDPVDPAQ